MYSFQLSNAFNDNLRVVRIGHATVDRGIRGNGKPVPRISDLITRLNGIAHLDAKCGGSANMPTESDLNSTYLNNRGDERALAVKFLDTELALPSVDGDETAVPELICYDILIANILHAVLGEDVLKLRDDVARRDVLTASRRFAHAAGAAK